MLDITNYETSGRENRNYIVKFCFLYQGKSRELRGSSTNHCPFRRGDLRQIRKNCNPNFINRFATISVKILHNDFFWKSTSCTIPVCENSKIYLSTFIDQFSKTLFGTHLRPFELRFYTNGCSRKVYKLQDFSPCAPFVDIVLKLRPGFLIVARKNDLLPIRVGLSQNFMKIPTLDIFIGS